MPIYHIHMEKGRYLREGFFDPGGAMVAHIRARHQGECPPHAHEFEELVIVVSGRGYHIVDQDEFAIARGDVFLLSDNRQHGYSRTHNLEIINLGYDRRELAAIAGDLGDCPGFHVLFSLEPPLLGRSGFGARLRLNPEQLRTVIGWADEIGRELAQEAPGYRTVCRAVFLQIAAFLSRAYAGRDELAQQPLWRLGEVLSFLERNFTEPTSIPALAKLAHLSVRQFYRAFQSATGQTPLEYLLRLRITAAQRLLERTDLPVGEIAARAGFSDSNYFSRQFRRLAGQSPQSYRQFIKNSDRK